MARINFSTEDFAQSALTYRPELVRIPILSLQSALQYMTLRTGIRYEENIVALDTDVELQPYKANAIQDTDTDVIVRKLHTYFGSCNKEFEPNAVISTILGHKAAEAAADGLAQTVSAQEVLALIAKKIGRKLLNAMWSAKVRENGKTTFDLFNGFDTITDKEIADGNISQAKGNYLMLSAVPGDLNAYALTREIVDAMSDELRSEEAYLFCSHQFYQAYCRSYKLETGMAPYNDKFEQTFVEGSNGNLKLVPLAGKKDSKYLHITTKANMLVGCDQESDLENVRVKDYRPDTVTFMLRMFFGVQFESIAPERLLVAEIPAAATESVEE